MQVTLVSDKYYSDLDVYFDDLSSKLATFLEVAMSKHGINFWPAGHVRCSHPTNDLKDTEPNNLGSGYRIVTNPVVLKCQVASLIEERGGRHIMFSPNLAGGELHVLIKTDLLVFDYVPLAELKNRKLADFSGRSMRSPRSKSQKSFVLDIHRCLRNILVKTSPAATLIGTLVQPRRRRSNPQPGNMGRNSGHRGHGHRLHQCLPLLG